MNIQNPHLLVSLFTTAFVTRLIQANHITFLNNVLRQTGFSKRLSKNASTELVLLRTFDYLNENYRCEYVFKAAVLNEVLLKRHNLRDTTYLTEFRSYQSKADIVILNGTSCVYEIKSDLDRLDRLDSQIYSYQKIFDKVFIVGNAQVCKHVFGIASNSIGVLCLNEDLSLSVKRDAKSNLHTLDKSIMFDSLRKPEYASIIEDVTGTYPDFPGTTVHSKCKAIFQKLSNTEAHNYFMNALKKRRLSEEQIHLANKKGLAVKALLADRHYGKDECQNIVASLRTKLC